MTDTVSTDPFAQTNSQSVNYLEAMTTKFNKDGALDVEGLAKGKFESDQFIAQLQTELAETRRKAEQGLAVKDLLEAIKNNPSQTGEPPLNQQVNTSSASNTPEDLQKVIRETINQSANEQREAANKAAVVNKLNETWGASSGAELAKKANELGITVKRLEEIGKESPSALFTLLGVNAVRAPNGTANVPTSTVSLPSTGTGERTKKYYDDLRRTNPKLYNNPKTQAQEHRDAIRLGPAFFDN